jgi:hypothetical protein
MLIKDVSGNYILTPLRDPTNSKTYGIHNLFLSIPKGATDDMFDMYGRLKPEYYEY